MALVVWRTGAWKLAMVTRSAVIGFEVFPKDGFVWISRNRRFARDFERYAMTVAALVRLEAARYKRHRRRVHPPGDGTHHVQAAGCKRLVMNPNVLNRPLT